MNFSVDRRRCWQALVALGMASTAWDPAVGQTRAWPRGTVNLVVPFPVGGTSAVLAKHLVKPFHRMTQQNLRLQHQGGAGGVAGSSYAANLPADGQHLLMGGSHLAVSRALAPEADFDFLEDLRPLTLVAQVPQVVLVHPGRMRVRTVTEWLAELGRKPARYRMGTAGIGSSSHIDAEMLRAEEGLQFEMVHFRGSGPALHDLLHGSVDMMVDGLVSCLPYVRSGRVKALMVSGSERVAALPEVPCAKELELSVLDSMSWYGLFAPSSMSDRQARSIGQALQALGQQSELQTSFAASGVAWDGLHGADFVQMVQAETLRWAQRLKRLGMVQSMLPSPNDPSRA